MCSDSTCQKGEAGTQEILVRHEEQNCFRWRWPNTESGAQNGCGIFIFGDMENLTGILSYHEDGPAVVRVWSWGHVMGHSDINCFMVVWNFPWRFSELPSVSISSTYWSRGAFYVSCNLQGISLFLFLLRILSFHGVLKQGILHSKCMLYEEPNPIMFHFNTLAA